MARLMIFATILNKAEMEYSSRCGVDGLTERSVAVIGCLRSRGDGL